ncbi:glutathione S-transferase 3, mitochondrial-like [Sycon ciliatum]|uniref:glutathione S-transferase 3, mitochondrial-like n=1 Tax=Sycon ciliatum TaxID=27933 RepID=UPI0020AD846C|eukprot:scpid82420/ scgid29754/ Microsomal glutathione S-transferase 3; Microsomal GST-III
MSASMENVLPKEYGYVLLTGAVGGFLMNIYLGTRVGKARKQHDVKYPAMYSATNDRFNCIQRAHQNFLEALPLFLTTGLIAGVYHPIIASVFNVIYLLGRLIYAQGYSTGDPEKRGRGSFMYIGYLGNVGLTIYTALCLLRVV